MASDAQTVNGSQADRKYGFVAVVETKSETLFWLEFVNIVVLCGNGFTVPDVVNILGIQVGLENYNGPPSAGLSTWFLWDRRQ